MLKYFMAVDNSQTAVDDSHTAVATAKAAIIAFFAYRPFLTLLATKPKTKDNSLCFEVPLIYFQFGF